VQEFSLRSDLASPTLLAFGALGPCAPYRDIPTTIQASVATSTLPREDNRQNKSPARAHVCAKICGCVSAASVKNALHQEPFVAVRHTSGGKAILFKIYYPWWPKFQSAICGYYEVDFRPLTGSGQSALSVIGRFDVRHCFSGVGYMIQIRRHFLFSTPI
jgi:hypothetical protein